MKYTIYSFLLLAFFTGCGGLNYDQIQGEAQGTTYSIVAEQKIDKAALKSEIDSFLMEFDNALSTYNPTSALSRLNNNVIENSSNTYLVEMFKQSVAVNNATDGLFDPTIKPLIDGWGFGEKSFTPENPPNVDSLLALCGLNNYSLENGVLTKLNPLSTLNFNAIAQGYSVDLIALLLESKGIMNYMVELGGELKTLGLNTKGEDWRLGIDKPVELDQKRELQAIVKLSGKALATSGNYRNYVEMDGERFSHTINAKTGIPGKSNILSTSVIAEFCSMADAYATALMVMDIEKMKILVDNVSEIEALVIYDSAGTNQVWKSAGWPMP
jgi:thiamine biosynthesis lipoprotein